MGNYDTIQIPVSGQPVSKAQYGDRVRAAIVDLDARVSRIESTLSNYARKTTTTTRANTTTVSDDPDLKMWLEANSSYFVEFFVTTGSIAAEDIKTSWSVPSGVTTTNRRVMGPGSNSSDVLADNIAGRYGTHLFATTLVYNGVRNAAGNQYQLQEIAVVTTGATAGYVAFQWAQGTSGATGTVVYAESFARATKLP
jgi:hypothetical protein